MTTADPASGRSLEGARVAPPEEVDDWERQVVWWDAVFVALVVLTAVALPLGGQSGRQLWVAYAAMAVVLVAYAALGAPAARSGDRGRSVAYVVVLIVATTVAVSQGGLATFLLLGAFAQLWLFLQTRREAVLASAVLTVAATAALASVDGFSAGSLRSTAPQMAIALGFALALGLWTATWMRRSEERARLLRTLRATQDELARTHHAAGVTAERERVAREIHDTLAQGFISVVTQAQAAAAALDRGEVAAAHRRLTVVETTARDNLAEARGLVAAFSPAPLQEGSLDEALRRVADRFVAETGTAARVDVGDRSDGGAGASPTADVVLLRAAQEALANVRRHAGATAVTLRLSRRADGVELEVCDDGRGLPEPVVEGFGLAGMRERAAAAGGSLELGTGAAGGARVLVRLPGSTA
ncbi:MULTISPECIES: sensor histidine kinase [unclassified Isoptericola]|uniref:sensor histidine kinase n=1 Tax=unclassified Isoptericola TaxID=2623355 RepID=UPI002712FDBD|nr:MULTISPECIES: sensor histidine kinase [unclassified Isoptericola]MDO8143205.1 sensor histidine kinase [Isoptericola sp. 178]MDO8147066.1 sensor histidine kinase [Isoptericola sp. b515]